MSARSDWQPMTRQRQPRFIGRWDLRKCPRWDAVLFSGYERLQGFLEDPAAGKVRREKNKKKYSLFGTVYPLKTSL